MEKSFRLGIDTGGTFTDVALLDENKNEIYITKVSSTPENPNQAVVRGMEKIIKEKNIDPTQVRFFIHGTTVATNALLEKKGASSALITTRGFADVLHIGRQERPNIYDNKVRRPNPLIPRYLRFEVEERLDHKGHVLSELKEKEVEKIASKLTAEGVKSVAVCLLHSYKNPVHEKKIKEIMEGRNFYITLSSDILPEFREYERMSTTVINAYVMPIMNRYIEILESELKKYHLKSHLYIMQSNGGVITAQDAREVSARTVLSGPAGGTLGSSYTSHLLDRPNVLSLDMGGTSADISLIYNGKPEFTTQSIIGGYPINLPMIQINTIGAGGGSIAWLDAGGALRVGPESAGAEPGPVCYNRGGVEPTVTDANMLLGRLSPEYILGGEMRVVYEKAIDVIKEKVATPLNLSIYEAAEGIIKVINANMIRGIRVVSIEKGYDPREFSLIAFGGAGPLQAAELAKEMDINEVIIPLYPGISSAIGMLTADVRHDYVQTKVKPLATITVEEIEEIFSHMMEEAYQNLRKDGFTEENLEFRPFVDLRYSKQAYELTIPVNDRKITSSTLDKLTANFHSTHHKTYGYHREGHDEVELVNVRLISTGLLPRLKLSRGKVEERKVCRSSIKREVYFSGGFQTTSIFQRNELENGHVVEGPAVIEQLDTTTLILPGQKGIIDEFSNIIIA